MFSTEIVNSDPFLEMPATSQALYFHLGMAADDDGFVYPKKIMRMTGSSDDDLKILLSKKFVLIFETGVLVVKHWRVNNYIRPDRYHPTPHREQMAQLSTDKGMVYHLSTKCPTEVSKEVSKEVKGENIPEPERELRSEERAQRLEEMRTQLTARKIIK